MHRAGNGRVAAGARWPLYVRLGGEMDGFGRWLPVARIESCSGAGRTVTVGVAAGVVVIVAVDIPWWPGGSAVVAFRKQVSKDLRRAPMESNR